MEHFESLGHVLQDLLGYTYLPNEVELLGIYGRVSPIIAYNIHNLKQLRMFNYSLL